MGSAIAPQCLDLLPDLVNQVYDLLVGGVLGTFLGSCCPDLQESFDVKDGSCDLYCEGKHLVVVPIKEDVLGPEVFSAASPRKMDLVDAVRDDSALHGDIEESACR